MSADKFSSKVLLITGGTGSFGNAVLKRFLQSDLSEIRILSRDEKKQDDMRKRYNSSKVKFYLGDVRDYQSVVNAVRGVDFVFHAAALKQVPSCEFHPMEAVKTNVVGTENVLEAAINCGVEKVVCLSTDKAVYPINAMGISKAMMEKIRAGEPITITDPSMTRFMMTLDDAVDLVLYAFEHGNPGDIFVQKAPAATIQTLAYALTNLLKTPEHNVREIGTRHGEKLFEVLLSREEMASAEDLGDYFRVPPDLRDLNYGKFVEEGERKISEAEDYNSHNTTRLDNAGMQELLMKLDFIRAIVRGENAQPQD